MRRSRRLSWLAVLLATILLSGCEYPDDDEATNEAGVGQSETSTGGCTQAGPQTGQWLPVLDSANERQATITTQENPCLPFSDLLGLVSDMLSGADAPDAGTVTQFRDRVGVVANRFLAAADAVECGYETDGLAIVVYQHADHPWSVGLVVVVRLSVGAVVEAGFCYLGEQFDADVPGQFPRSGGNQIKPGLCGLAAQPEGYAVVALGTSNWMCGALATSPAGLVQVL